MARPRSGSLPSTTNSTMPIASVTPSAISGDASASARDGSARGSSLSKPFLLAWGGGAAAGLGPDAAHPFADQRARGCCASKPRGEASACHDHQRVTQLEQLVELLAHDQQR